MITITGDNQSINDLAMLHKTGAPVTLTSHPGNASLYKQVLWRCGIPETLWDVTCCIADANNWPMYRLVGGDAELLVSEELRSRITQETSRTCRFITAYQFAATGERLGRVHVRAMQERFPNAISSQSRVLLRHRERIHDLFDYLARTKPEKVFTREITPDGIMRPFDATQVDRNHLATAFINLLTELEHLLFSDEPIETRGGPCYDGPMIALSVCLAQFWETDRVDRYDVSGPDMINYARRNGYKEALSEMLGHCRSWNPELVPEDIRIFMYPGTFARVGHVTGHPSDAVMRRKVLVLENSLSREEKLALADAAVADNRLWPIKISPCKSPYFSQHDLCNVCGDFEVDNFWRCLPINGLHDSLVRANNILRIR